MTRGLAYPDTIPDGITTITALSAADFVNAPEAQRATVAPDAWPKAALAWMLHLSTNDEPAAGRVRASPGRLIVEDADIRATRDTVRMFSGLDCRFGGAHARHLVAEFIRRDLARGPVPRARPRTLPAQRLLHRHGPRPGPRRHRRARSGLRPRT